MRIERIFALLFIMSILHGCVPAQPRPAYNHQRAYESCSSEEECIRSIHNAIMDSWVPPADAENDLKAVLQVEVDKEGKLTSIKIPKRSGDRNFDYFAVEAIKSASPFPEFSFFDEDKYNKIRTMLIIFEP